MEFIPAGIDGVFKIQPVVHRDHRGFFMEWYSAEKFSKAGIENRFVQDNHSCSKEKGILRGLHFQKPPFAQAKLVRVLQGKIFDVAVDLRKSSPTYGKWVGFELSEENRTMLFIPVGFAHGFVTLEPDTHVEYKVDALYVPNYDSGIIWNDPEINIPWPIEKPILSPKDANLPMLKDNPSPF